MASKEITCEICGSHVKSLRLSRGSCKTRHSDSQRACEQCWEAHISTEIEEKEPGQIECMFCDSVLPEVAITKLARVATRDRYTQKLLDSKGRTCMGSCIFYFPKHPVQPFDRSTAGRMFTCAFCSFAVCTDCDRPEHYGETCNEYRARVMRDSRHVQAEADTRSMVNFDSCPGCGCVYEMEKGCGYTQCSACKFGFCERCKIPWTGIGSAYLHGKEAHNSHCLYRTRDAPSKHGLSKRFRETAEVQKCLDENEDKKVLKRKARAEAKGGECKPKKGRLAI